MVYMGHLLLQRTHVCDSVQYLVKMILRHSLALLLVVAAVLGQIRNQRADRTYAGWNVLEVKSLPPFLNPETFGFPSHIDLLSFNTGTGTTVLAVAQEKVTLILQQLADAGVAFQTKIQDLSQLFLSPRSYDLTRSLPRGDATFDRYMYYQEDRLWRKNRAQSAIPECFGVDLNRNFDFYWGGVEASTNPCSDMYQGSNPFSEPETRALREAVSKVKRRTKAYVALHSYGQTFLYPWSYSRAINNSSTRELIDIAAGMTKKIEAAGGTRYNISSSTVSLLVGGASDDWVASQGVPYVYTMELRDRGETVFHLPEHLIVPTGEDVWAAMKYLGRKLRHKKKQKKN
ncbi:carboxypeptidase B-like [Penaeus japonicus]|uniref:carboxypeptidase B-like n=1 Tax=Penaeus japonicus TaxID=27405 RepID=UPI001C70B036|nr:carboxypeptidase B-like [Penaeus japonicus]